MTSDFKSQVALAVLEDKKSVDELAQEHDIPPAKIKQWVRRIRKQSATLFPDEEWSDSENRPSELRNYLSLLRATLDATANGILVVDLEGHITIYNERFLQIWDIPEEVIAGEDDETAVQFVLDRIQEPQTFLDKVDELYNKPEASSKDEIQLKDGRIIERYSFPQRIGDKVVGRVWSFMDVTESRTAQQKMNRFARLLKSINENVEEAILRSTPSEGLVYVNDAFVEMFGYESKEEALNTPPAEYYHNDEQRWHLVKKLKEEGSFSNQEVQYRRKNGSTFWGLENCTLVEVDGREYIDCVILDITKRREVEEALRQSEEKYRTIIENIEDGYFETDLEGRFTFVNDSIERILGYSREQLLMMDKANYMDRKNALSIMRVFRTVYDTGRPEQGYDWEIITRDGERRTVEASISLIEDKRGEPVGFRGIVRDITERIRYQQQIERSLKEKEVLLGEIHHRVKNNLAVISGLLYLQADQTMDETARSVLEQSQSRIHSMAMVHEMLYDTKSFSSITPETYIRRLIDYITRNLDHGEKEISTVVHTGHIQLHMKEAIPCALIINELITNAYKYAFPGRKQGNITVRFESEDENYYRLEIADDGVGFEKKPDLATDTGEGLGLYLVDTLVKQLRGTVDIDLSEGTRFIIRFPAGEHDLG